MPFSGATAWSRLATFIVSPQMMGRAVPRTAPRGPIIVGKPGRADDAPDRRAAMDADAGLDDDAALGLDRNQLGDEVARE
jgi:hypothetical protein